MGGFAVGEGTPNLPANPAEELSGQRQLALLCARLDDLTLINLTLIVAFIRGHRQFPFRDGATGRKTYVRYAQLAILAVACSAAAFISSCVRSLTWVAIDQRCPKGSMTCPQRSPQNWLV